MEFASNSLPAVDCRLGCFSSAGMVQGVARIAVCESSTTRTRTLALSIKIEHAVPVAEALDIGQLERCRTASMTLIGRRGADGAEETLVAGCRRRLCCAIILGASVIGRTTATLDPPDGRPATKKRKPLVVRRRDRLGGLLHGRCQVVRAVRRQALNRLVTTTAGRFGRDLTLR